MEKVIEKIKEATHIDEENKAAIIEKLKEWKSDEHAESNKLAVAFEKFWADVEPIFAELGLV